MALAQVPTDILNEIAVWVRAFSLFIAVHRSPDAVTVPLGKFSVVDVQESLDG